MKIRKAISSDVDNIYKVHLDSGKHFYQECYSAHQINLLYKNKKPSGYLNIIDDIYLISDEKNNTLGWIHCSDNEIHGLYIHPQHIKKGIGKTLVEFSLENLLNTSKHIKIQSSLFAVDFYKKMGFIITNYENVEIENTKIAVVNMEYKKSLK